MRSMTMSFLIFIAISITSFLLDCCECGEDDDAMTMMTTITVTVTTMMLTIRVNVTMTMTIAMTILIKRVLHIISDFVDFTYSCTSLNDNIL